VSMPGPCEPDLQSAARFLSEQYGIR